MDKLSTFLKSLRGEMKKSRFKIWMRAFLFVQFSLPFSVYFFRDIGHGYFRWEWVVLVFACFIAEADFIMASIIGIMFGRLGGIGLRVRRLKLQHGFLKS